MNDRWLTTCLILWTYWFNEDVTSTLIERVRERQKSEENRSKGLDLPDRWLHVPQAIQDVLASIDDRLHGLDTFGYTLKLARLDFSLEQLVRRLENIEAKLGRLETKFDLRMEKVEEVVIGKDIKEEFTNEQLTRRLEHLNDKLNTKTSFLDAKIDIRMERISNKLELLERDLHSSVDDILEKLVKSDERYSQFENIVMGKFTKVDDVVTSINDLRLFLKEEFVNLLQKRMDKLDENIEKITDNLENMVQSNSEQTEKINNSFKQVNTKLEIVLNNTQQMSNISGKYNSDVQMRSLLSQCEWTNYTQQLDILSSLMQKSVKMEEIKFQKLENDIEMYTKKVLNNIQELWKNSDEHKILLTKILECTNRSHDIIRQELRNKIDYSTRCETKLSNIDENVNKKLNELKSTVDTSFATILVAQNTFIASCRRIQQEEAHIYDILQQIVHEMRNRSVSDIYKIRAEIEQSGHKFRIELMKILEAIYFAGNHTAHKIEMHENRCIATQRNDKNYWRSILNHSTDINDQIVLNETNIHNSSTSAHSKDGGFLETNDFQELINNTEQLDRIRPTETNNSFSNIMNDYENDYPGTEDDYTDTSSIQD